MLKGHTVIELTDVKTGEREVISKQNMVTNALAEHMTFDIAISDKTQFENSYLPLSQLGMGGILLFEDTLEENANKYDLPAANSKRITGYANNTANTTTDTKRGSKNLTESKRLINGYKYVWDFATSQGNGTIAAIALTSSNNGTAPYTNSGTPYEYSIEYESIPTNDSKEENYKKFLNLKAMTEFNADDFEITCIRMISSTQLVRTKYRMVWQRYGINSKRKMFELISKDIKEIDQTKTTINVSANFIDGNDGYIYSVYKGTTSSGAIVITRLDKETLTQDVSYGTKTTKAITTVDVIENPGYKDDGTFIDSYMSYNNSRVAGSTGYGTSVIMKGHLYIPWSAKYLNKINLANIEDITYITLPSSVKESENIGLINEEQFFFGKYYVYSDDSVMLSSGTHSVGIEYSTSGVYYTGNTKYHNGRGIQIGCYSRESAQIRIGAMRNYLATINNLDTPVIKTADKTMKITYTLTEE